MDDAKIKNDDHINDFKYTNYIITSIIGSILYVPITILFISSIMELNLHIGFQILLLIFYIILCFATLIIISTCINNRISKKYNTHVTDAYDII